MGDKKSIKVLVVDDEKIIRSFFVRLLLLLNLEVVEAESGDKAIELVKAGQSFDLFFIDAASRFFSDDAPQRSTEVVKDIPP